jgi:hypothetical protein
MVNFVNGFSQNIGTIQYIDPDVDYDGYCAYAKSCDVRKSTTTFIMNCLKKDQIRVDQVYTIIRENIACIRSSMDEEGKTKEVEELVENLFIMMTMGKSHLTEATEWINAVKDLAKLKGKSHVSWSNRAAFKMLDLVDAL